jgi:hypothetical protein
MDKHVLFTGHQTVRASSKDTKGSWPNKHQAKKKKSEQERGTAETSKKHSNVVTPSQEKDI